MCLFFFKELNVWVYNVEYSQQIHHEMFIMVNVMTFEALLQFLILLF